jgi:hypothetical protein
LDVVVDQNQVRERVSVRVRVRVNLWLERVLSRQRFERVNLRLELYLFPLDVVVDVVGSVSSDVIDSMSRA